MLAVTGAVFVLAAVALALGLRGRRVDDHPFCRKCGFDLFGTYPDHKICPECGVSLTRTGGVPLRSRIRLGKRQRRGWVIFAALTCLLLSVVVGCSLLWDELAGDKWYSYKPTWWLMLDTRSRSPATVEAALVELQTRQALKALSTDQSATLLERGLAWQADPSRPWVKAWGDLIETAWMSGELTDGQKKSYAAHAVQLELVARAKVKQGDRVAASIHLHPRIGSAGVLAFELRLPSMKLGQQELLGQPFFAIGNMDGAWPTNMPIAFASQPEFGGRIPQSAGDAMVKSPPGNYSLTTTWSLRVAEQDTSTFPGRGYSWGRGLDDSSFFPRKLSQPLHECDLDLTAAIEVVPPSATTVELVSDKALADAVRRSISIRI